MTSRSWIHYAAVIVAGFGGAALLISSPQFELDPKISLPAIVGLTTLGITLLEVRRNIRTTRAGLVRDHVAHFIKDRELFSAYFDLVYNYDDAIFKAVNEAYNKVPPGAIARPNFEFIPSEYKTDERQVPGRRIYHPGVFQGSLEEQRLDALLSYFDLLGYYYRAKLIDIEEIAGTIGYYLLFLRERDVIRAYLDICRQAWQNPDYKKITQKQPFLYLGNLLEDLHRFDRHHKERLRDGELPT